MRNLALEVNYVWRKYDNFVWSDRLNWDFGQLPSDLADANELLGRWQTATP